MTLKVLFLLMLSLTFGILATCLEESRNVIVNLSKERMLVHNKGTVLANVIVFMHVFHFFLLFSQRLI